MEGQEETIFTLRRVTPNCWWQLWHSSQSSSCSQRTSVFDCLILSSCTYHHKFKTILKYLRKKHAWSLTQTSDEHDLSRWVLFWFFFVARTRSGVVVQQLQFWIKTIFLCHLRDSCNNSNAETWNIFLHVYKLFGLVIIVSKESVQTTDTKCITT